MAVTSGFFNSKNGDRTYNAEQMSSLFAGIIKDGVFDGYPAEHDHFVVTKSTTEPKVTVGPGRAWFKNVWLDNDSGYDITLNLAPAGQERIDALYFKIDKSNNGRRGSIVKFEGTPGTHDSAREPTVNNTDTIFYYKFCLIRMTSTGIDAGSPYQPYIGLDIPYIENALGTFDDQAQMAIWEQNVNTYVAQQAALYFGNDSSAIYAMIRGATTVWCYKNEISQHEEYTINITMSDQYNNKVLYPDFITRENGYGILGDYIPKLGDVVIGANGYYGVVTSVSSQVNNNTPRNASDVFTMTVSSLARTIAPQLSNTQEVFLVSFWGRSDGGSVAAGCDRTWNDIFQAQRAHKLIQFRWTDHRYVPDPEMIVIPEPYETYGSIYGTQYSYSGGTPSSVSGGASIPGGDFLFTYDNIQPDSSSISNFSWTKLTCMVTYGNAVIITYEEV